MYFPWRGSHLTIIDAGSKTELVISATLSCSWYAFSAEMIGAYDVSMKWIRGYGTKFVWNSVMSTLRAPSKRSDAVSEEITCARRRLRFVYVGASLSTWLVTSVCSRREWTQSTVLYGSTHAEEICGHDQTVNEILLFLP